MSSFSSLPSASHLPISTEGISHPNRYKHTEKDPSLYSHRGCIKACARPADIVDARVFGDWYAGFSGGWGGEGEKELGSFVKSIQQWLETQGQITGVGYNFIEQGEGNENDESVHIHIAPKYAYMLLNTGVDYAALYGNGYGSSASKVMVNLHLFTSPLPPQGVDEWAARSAEQHSAYR
ncbi:hypothetical protein GYMLUDRAFT_249964 [Collybiopsis luxurians FD-317 M1]|uniref:Uncharacterized protein n=1 Tax=Collybiopsis luxurians FD-317 M1 TaxID=944289 RepID=A0A0D0BGU1_9AGAR|nr:hypothetical protein GYMLUDRAFT_249964 [Collybiopsis luxurians FD-317 M1]